MSRYTVMLLAAAATGFAGTASAMPLSNLAVSSDDLKQNVRLVCDRWGNCYETRRQARRVYRQNYYPYYRAPHAYSYYGAPYRSYGYGGPEIGFSFGFGSHRGWGW